jgi:hypothetical protein
MFQFPGFAFVPYLIQEQIPSFDLCKRQRLNPPPGKAQSRIRTLAITEIEGGFPHSEIHGSKPVRGSP